VQDTPNLLALYWRAGNPEKAPAKRLIPQDLLSEGVCLADREWTETDVLMLARPGEAHSVEVMWETGQTSLRCWYINLQEPLRRTAIGFDTMDHLLDIVISPDRTQWRWKDEEEFQEAVAIGVYSPEEARAIQAEGKRVIELLRTGQPPFCDGWDRWSAPAEWEIPQLPDGWDRGDADEAGLCHL